MQKRFLLMSIVAIAGGITTWRVSVGGAGVSGTSVLTHADGHTSEAAAVAGLNADAGAVDEVAVDALPVQLDTLQAVAAMDRRLSFMGTVFAARRSALAFERSGRLERVLVEQGDRVLPGQSLAIIDYRQLQLQMQELAARRDQQQALLEELLAGPRQETIAAAEAEVAALTAEAELRRVTFERTQQLFDRKASGEQVLDESRYVWKSTASRRDAAARRLEELQAGTRKEQLAGQQAAVAILDAQLQRLQIDLQDSTLVAPFAGRIVRRFADEGSMVNAQQPIVELLETSRLEARIGVSTDLTAQLQKGQQCSLIVGGAGASGSGIGISNSRHFSGRLISATLRDVLPQIDPATRTQTVILDIDEPFAESLDDGELVRWELYQSVEVEGCRVPITSLSAGTKGLWSIYLAVTADPPSAAAAAAAADADADADAGTGSGRLLPRSRDLHSGRFTTGTVFHIQARPVEVLLTDGDYAVIRGDVRAGERYVVNGSHRLVSGQRVIRAGEVRRNDSQNTNSSDSAEERN